MTRINGPRYRGVSDLAVVDVASDLADWGAFILPAASVPFQYSGRPVYREQASKEYRTFHEVTQIELSAESIDCAVYDGWHGVRPQVGMVSTDFTEARRARRAKETAGLPAADLFSWAVCKEAIAPENARPGRRNNPKGTREENPFWFVCHQVIH